MFVKALFAWADAAWDYLLDLDPRRDRIHLASLSWISLNLRAAANGLVLVVMVLVVSDTTPAQVAEFGTYSARRHRHLRLSS